MGEEKHYLVAARQGWKPKLPLGLCWHRVRKRCLVTAGWGGSFSSPLHWHYPAWDGEGPLITLPLWSPLILWKVGRTSPLRSGKSPGSSLGFLWFHFNEERKRCFIITGGSVSAGFLCGLCWHHRTYCLVGMEVLAGRSGTWLQPREDRSLGSPLYLCRPRWSGATVFLWCLASLGWWLSKSSVLPGSPFPGISARERRLSLRAFCVGVCGAGLHLLLFLGCWVL